MKLSKPIRDFVRAMWPKARRHEYAGPFFYPDRLIKRDEAYQICATKRKYQFLITTYQDLIQEQHDGPGSPVLISLYDLQNALAKWKIDSRDARHNIKKTLAVGR